MKGPKLTAGQALVRLLENYGVDTVFGIPGVHTLELYRGLPDSRIRHVLTRHEQGAGFMADGYARSTGKPGVCFLISGPGITNAATAIGQAYSDSIPMLIISSVNATASLGKGWGCLHECKDQSRLTEAITAFSALAHQPEDIPDLLARAFTVFANDRPRPVHISIPIDVLARSIERDWTGDVRSLAPRPVPAEASITQALDYIERSRSPALIVGGGAVDAAPQILALAERLGASVFTTVAGKGMMPADHDLYQGSVLCVAQGWEAIAQADLVIAIGTEMAETDFWRERLEFTAPLLRVDVDPRKMNDQYPCAVALCGDAGKTLDLLLARLGKASAPYRADRKMSATGDSVRSHLAELQRTHLAIIQTIEASIPKNTRVTCDMTQLAYSANYLMSINGPRHWLAPTGFGTLGYGLPAGIGAQIAEPEVPVLVLVGDGGILYTLTELATAREEVRGSLVVLLWNNDALGQIHEGMLEIDIEPIGVLPLNPNFIDLARAFGCTAVRPANLTELAIELKSATNRPGVTVIELEHGAVTPLSA